MAVGGLYGALRDLFHRAVQDRQQYGLRPFAEISIICFVLASCLNLFVTDLHSAIVVRFVSGMAAAPLSSLGFLYILEAFPVQRKLTLGLSIALTGTLLSSPLARILSPDLLQIDGWQALYSMEVGLSLAVLPIIYLLPLTPPPRAKVIERIDILSYLLFAGGLGCLAVFLTLGRFTGGSKPGGSACCWPARWGC